MANKFIQNNIKDSYHLSYQDKQSMLPTSFETSSKVKLLSKVREILSEGVHTITISTFKR